MEYHFYVKEQLTNTGYSDFWYLADIFSKISSSGQVPVTHICNPSVLGS
jgi:hypothetical protein